MAACKFLHAALIAGNSLKIHIYIASKITVIIKTRFIILTSPDKIAAEL
jgi:hypothetical protein